MLDAKDVARILNENVKKIGGSYMCDFRSMCALYKFDGPNVNFLNLLRMIVDDPEGFKDDEKYVKRNWKVSTIKNKFNALKRFAGLPEISKELTKDVHDKIVESLDQYLMHLGSVLGGTESKIRTKDPFVSEDDNKENENENENEVDDKNVSNAEKELQLKKGFDLTILDKLLSEMSDDLDVVEYF